MVDYNRTEFTENNVKKMENFFKGKNRDIFDNLEKAVYTTADDMQKQNSGLRYDTDFIGAIANSFEYNNGNSNYDNAELAIAFMDTMEFLTGIATLQNTNNKLFCKAIDAMVVIRTY